MMKRELDPEKMSVFEQIREGLNESIAHSRGQLTLKSTTLLSPAPPLTKARVIAIRKSLRMSQSVFASYLNVPKKTLQSWEQGARAPKAGEARLLQLFGATPDELVSLMQRLERVKPKRARTKS